MIPMNRAEFELVKQGKKIHAIKAYRDRTGASLSQAKSVIDSGKWNETGSAEGGGASASLGGKRAMNRAEYELARGGNVIGAIKAYRARTFTSLSQAKAVVDSGVWNEGGVASGSASPAAAPSTSKPASSSTPRSAAPQTVGGFGPHYERPLAVATSPASGLIAIGGTRTLPTPVASTVHLLSRDYESVARHAIGRPVTALAFLSDQLLLVGGQDGSLNVVGAGGESLPAVSIHREEVTGIAAFGGEHVATVGADGHLRLFRVTGAGAFEEVANRELSERALRAVGFAPDGKTVACAGDDGVVRSLKLDALDADPREMPVSTEKKSRGAVYSLAFTDDGRVIAGCADGSIQLCFLSGDPTPEDRSRKAEHESKVIALFETPVLLSDANRRLPRRLISISADGAAKLWDLDSKRRPKTVALSGSPTAATFMAPREGAAAAVRGGALVVVNRARQLATHPISEAPELGGAKRLGSRFEKLKSDLEPKKKVEVQLAAVTELTSLAEDEARVLLDRALIAKDATVRAASARAMGSTSRRLSRPALRVALSDADETVRFAAYDALVELEKDTPLAPVRAALGSSQHDVRVRAVEALPLLRAASPLVPALVAGALKDKHEAVRAKALDALYSLEPSGSVEPVRIALARGADDIRLEALLRLGRAGQTREGVGRELVEAALDDAQLSLRSAAFTIAIASRGRLATALRNADPALADELDAAEKHGSFGDGATGAPTDADKQPLFAALTCRNTDVALRAARGLGVLGDHRSVGALLQLSREPDAAVRRAAIGAIKKTMIAIPSDDRLGARLEWLLDDDSAEVRTDAWDALVEARGKTGLAELDLAELALRCASQDVRLRAQKTLVEFGGSGRYARETALIGRADDLLGEALDDEAATVRSEALKTLLAWSSGDDGMTRAAIKRAAQSRHADIRTKIVSQLGPEVDWQNDLLLSLCRDASASVGRAAYGSLTTKKGQPLPSFPSSVTLAALSSPRPEVRAFALNGTKTSSDGAVVTRIRELIEDDREVVHLAAIVALDRLAPNDASGFATAFASIFYGLRVRAMELCGRRRDARALSPAKAFLSIPKTHLSRPTEPLRQRAARALADVGHASAMPFLVGLLDDEDPLIRETAARGLATAARPNNVQPLVDAMAHPDLPVRSWVAEGLARLGDDRALPVLTGTLSHDHRPLRMGAVMGMVALGPDGVRGMLRALDDNDRDIQDLVFGVIVARDVELAKAGKAPDLLTSALSSKNPEIRFTAARLLEARPSPEQTHEIAKQLVGPRHLERQADMKDWPENQDALLNIIVSSLASDNPAQRYAAAQVVAVRSQPMVFWREAAHLGGPRVSSALRIPHTNWANEPKQPRKRGWIRALFSRREVETTNVPELVFGTYAGLVRQAPASGENDTTHRVRRDAIKRLGALSAVVGRDAVMPVLRRALSDPHNLVRKASVAAIRGLYEESSLEPLDLMLRSSAADVGKSAVDEALTRAVAGDEAAAGLVRGAVNAPHPDVRKHCMMKLPRLYEANSLEPWFVALESRYTDVRLGVVDRLAQARDPRVADALSRALESDHDDLRLKAAVALARRGDARTVDVLSGMLHNEQQRVARSALNALLTLSQARPEDEDRDARQAAASLAFASRLEDDPDQTADKSALIDALARVGHEAGGDVLLALVRGEDAALRARAIPALITIATDPARGVREYPDGTKRPKMRDALALRYAEVIAESDDAPTRQRVIPMLRNVEDKGAETLLGTLVEDRNVDTRVQACEALAFRARYAEGATLGALSTTLRGGARELVLPAAEGMAQRKRKEAFRPLLLVYKAGEQHERKRAIAALGELGDARALEELEILVDPTAELEPFDRELAPDALTALGRMLPSLEDPEPLGRVREIVERQALQGNSTYRAAAMRGLRYAGDERSRGLLERVAVDQYEDGHARQTATNLLIGMKHRGSESVFADLLLVSDRRLRGLGLTGLKALFPDDLTRVYLHALKSTASDMTGPAASYLSKHGDPETLVGGFKSIGNNGVRRSLRRGLVRRSAFPASAMNEILNGDYHDALFDVVAMASASGETFPALTTAGRTAAAQFAKLKTSGGNATEVTRAATAWQFTVYSAETVALATETLGNKDAPMLVVQAAIRRVAREGGADARALITPLLGDSRPEVRAAASAAIADLAPNDAGKVLESLTVPDPSAVAPLIRKSLDASADLLRGKRRAIALPIAIADKRLASLSELAKQPGKDASRLAAIASLGRLAGEGAVAVLEGILANASEDSDVRGAAFRALRRAQRIAAKAEKYATEKSDDRGGSQ